MKVSLNWVKQFTDVNLPIDKLVEKIGAQLGAVDGVESLAEKYKGALVVKVVSCVKHANADKLSVCMINDGGVVKQASRDKDGLVQVVCGAPNVTAGQTVVWLPPGATVPNTVGKEPFVLEARELRGVVSNGMIASAKELDFGDDHTGILVINEKIRPGTSLIKALELDDHIIDIENKMFTHRPDCFGILGVAREIAGISGHPFKSPAWYKETLFNLPKGGERKLVIKNDCPELVPRFMAQVMTNVKVGPSPARIQSYLSRLGVRPINNIVDITNYIMLLTGQPLHAYDTDKLGTNTLGIRLSRAGENLNLIGGKNIKLKSGAIVITDGYKPVGLGGVMGGADTQVDESTKNIILEAATFDMNLTRKTAFEYGLFTDAATRFTKNQSPRQTLAALGEATLYAKTYAKGTVDALVDDKHLVREPAPIHVPAQFINERLGLSLSAIEMKRLLDNVEFTVRRDAGKLAITPPFWRTDIEIPEDIVEEIGRLYGYDHLRLELPKRDIQATDKNEQIDFKIRLRNILTQAGANEVLTYSFVHGDLLESAGQNPAEQAYHVRNALSPDLQYYRTSLALSLLEKIHPNVKAGYESFALFEIGKVHVKGSLNDEKLPKEHEWLAMVITTVGSVGAPYYQAQYFVDYLLRELNLPSWQFNKFDPSQGRQPAGKAYDGGRSAKVMVGQEMIGLVGEPTTQVSKRLKLSKSTAMFELDIKKLQALSHPPLYSPLARYPSTTQDICLRLPQATAFRTADDFVWNFLNVQAPKHGYNYVVQTLDIFQKQNDKSHKQITWRVSLNHPERTLTNDEANALLDNLASVAKTKLHAERI